MSGASYIHFPHFKTLISSGINLLAKGEQLEHEQID